MKWLDNIKGVRGFYRGILRTSGLFSAVIENDSKLPSSYLIEGSVDEFYERDAENEWEAVLSIGITLSLRGSRTSASGSFFKRPTESQSRAVKKSPCLDKGNEHSHVKNLFRYNQGYISFSRKSGLMPLSQSSLLSPMGRGLG